VLAVLTESDLRARYGRGRIRLLKWLLDPVFALGVYFVLVAAVLDRPGHARALQIACAVVPFQLVMTTFTSSLGAIRLRGSIVTNMRFERSLLPLATVLTETVAFVAALGLLFATMALSGVAPTRASLWLLLFIPQTIAIAVAIAYPATLFGLFFPDLRAFGVSAVRTLFFLAPSLVALDTIDGWVKDLLELNPLTGIFEGYRDALIYGRAPALWEVLIPFGYAALSLLIFVPFYRGEQTHFAKVVQ
jgi:lipopolysaccharide transport system permease protein